MIKIKYFAFCFFSLDESKVASQEAVVDKMSGMYSIEKWFRSERMPEKYLSFSQMVNDAIDDTESEFMIFCNPKTELCVEGVERILEKLSSGYCFASVVSFGFFGFSKELIRQVDMLDERFINGEWEDNDFAIRLNLLNKAVYWGYESAKYKFERQKSPNLGYISQSIFMDKYKILDDLILADRKMFKHKKISKRHRQNREDIFNSWLPGENTFCDCFLKEFLEKKVQLVDVYSEGKTVEVNIKLERNFENFRFELNTPHSIKVFFSVLENIEMGRKCLWNSSLPNNTWITFQTFCEQEVEVRLFLNDNQFYVNTLKPLDSTEINLRVPSTLKW